jgi:hypothetical protein
MGLDKTLKIPEPEFRFRFMRARLFLYGLGIWIFASLALRLGGQHILRPGSWIGTLVLFAVTFPLTARLVRGLCQRFQVPREQWPAAAVWILLPTLLLDPFSSAFFPVVYPNMAPELAGVFGGWMLCCCAGALAGVTIGRRA